MIPVEVEGNHACQIGTWFEASAIGGALSRMMGFEYCPATSRTRLNARWFHGGSADVALQLGVCTDPRLNK